MLVQKLHQTLDQHRAYAADAGAESIGAQKHHAPDFFFGIGIAGTDTVAEDQIGGELAAHLLGNGHSGKIAKAGGDPVGHAMLPHDLLRQVPGTSDRG